MVVHRFGPYADHLPSSSQTRKRSRTFSTEILGDLADDAWRIAVERHCVVVGSARYDHVPVTLALRDTLVPAQPVDAFDHVVEPDIALPSGKMAVAGATELPGEVEAAKVTAFHGLDRRLITGRRSPPGAAIIAEGLIRASSISRVAHRGPSPGRVTK